MIRKQLTARLPVLFPSDRVYPEHYAGNRLDVAFL